MSPRPYWDRLLVGTQSETRLEATLRNWFHRRGALAEAAWDSQWMAALFATFCQTTLPAEVLRPQATLATGARQYSIILSPLKGFVKCLEALTDESTHDTMSIPSQ